MDVKMKKYWSGRVSELREHINEILGYKNPIEWESEGYDSTIEQLKTHLLGEKQLTLEKYLDIDGSNKFYEIYSKLEALIPDEKPSFELQHELWEYIDVEDLLKKGMFSTGVDGKQHTYSGPYQPIDYWNIPEETHQHILDICKKMEARGNSMHNIREALVLYYFLIRPTIEEYRTLTNPANRDHFNKLKDTLNRCIKALEDCKKIILVIKDGRVHQALIYRNDQKRGVRIYRTPSADQIEGCNVLFFLRQKEYTIQRGTIELSTEHRDYPRVVETLKKGLNWPTMKSLRLGGKKKKESKEKFFRKTANHKLAQNLRPLYRFIKDNELTHYIPPKQNNYDDMAIIMDFICEYLNIEFSKMPEDLEVIKGELKCGGTKKTVFRVR